MKGAFKSSSRMLYEATVISAFRLIMCGSYLSRIAFHRYMYVYHLNVSLFDIFLFTYLCKIFYLLKRAMHFGVIPLFLPLTVYQLLIKQSTRYKLISKIQ